MRTSPGVNLLVWVPDEDLRCGGLVGDDGVGDWIRVLGFIEEDEVVREGGFGELPDLQIDGVGDWVFAGEHSFPYIISPFEYLLTGVLDFDRDVVVEDFVGGVGAVFFNRFEDEGGGGVVHLEVFGDGGAVQFGEDFFKLAAYFPVGQGVHRAAVDPRGEFGVGLVGDALVEGDVEGGSPFVFFCQQAEGGSLPGARSGDYFGDRGGEGVVRDDGGLLWCWVHDSSSICCMISRRSL